MKQQVESMTVSDAELTTSQERQRGLSEQSDRPEDGVPVVFVPMLETDLSDVIQIENQVYTHPWTLGNFRDTLVAGYPAWVLRQDGELLAYCVVMVVTDELHILNLSVAPKVQRRGLARAFLHYVDQQARQQNCDSVLLEVRVSNTRARDVYDRAGYSQIGLRRGYYPAPLGREDAIVMRKLVAEPAWPT